MKYIALKQFRNNKKGLIKINSTVEFSEKEAVQLIASKYIKLADSKAKKD